MATSLNMSWKIPLAYFLLGDNFKSKERASLIRQCIYKLNETQAIVTNIVMDNCPGNYATFRELGCNLSRNFHELNPATDIYNSISKNVYIIFDPPHLCKLGNFHSFSF